MEAHLVIGVMRIKNPLPMSLEIVLLQPSFGQNLNAPPISDIPLTLTLRVAKTKRLHLLPYTRKGPLVGYFLSIWNLESLALQEQEIIFKAFPI